MTKTKTCVKCGAEFKRSPADRTVNCPDCRKRPERTGPSDFYVMRYNEARSRAYAARAAHDTDAYEKAIADVRHWRAAMEAHTR